MGPVCLPAVGVAAVEAGQAQDSRSLSSSCGRRSVDEPQLLRTSHREASVQVRHREPPIRTQDACGRRRRVWPLLRPRRPRPFRRKMVFPDSWGCGWAFVRSWKCSETSARLQNR